MSQEYQYVVRPIASSIIANSSWSLTSAISAAVKPLPHPAIEHAKTLLFLDAHLTRMQFVGYSYQMPLSGSVVLFSPAVGAAMPTADFSRILLAFAQQYWNRFGTSHACSLLEIIFAQSSL